MILFPVHNPEKSAETGKLYWDVCWPSDGYPLVDEQGNGFSVAFIPGRLSDHDLLDDKYVYRLRMMSGSLSAAMEQGCWCELQGAYFANWKASKMVIPYGEIGAEWWDAHFLSLDYGFGNRAPRLTCMSGPRTDGLRPWANSLLRIFQPTSLPER